MAQALTKSCSIKCTKCGNSAVFKSEPPATFYFIDCDIRGDNYYGESFPVCSNCWNNDCMIVYYHDENGEVYDECNLEELIRNKNAFDIEPKYDYYD